MQPDSNPSLKKLPSAPLANLQKQEKFKNAGKAKAGLAKDTGFQQVGQRLPTSGSRETARQEQGKSRQEQEQATTDGAVRHPFALRHLAQRRITWVKLQATRSIGEGNRRPGIR
jgi:hypothetical protein